MVKTLLKSVLIILVLAGVFFFALQVWENKKGKLIPPGEAQKTAVPVTTVNRVDVQPAGDDATLLISDISPSNYSIRSTGTGNGFLVEVSDAQLSLVKTMISNPHPLISTVDVSQIPSGAQSAVRVRVDLAKDATYRDRVVGQTLYVDIVPKVEATPVPTAKPSMTPTPKPVKKPVSHVKKPPKPAVQHAVKKPVAVRKPKPVERPRKLAKLEPPPTPVPLEELVPPRAEPSELQPLPSTELAEPAIPPPPAAAAPSVQAPPKKKEEALSPELDLTKLFSESEPDLKNVAPPPAGQPAAPPAEEPPMEQLPSVQPPKVAAVPPSSGVFESSKIRKLLLRVENLSVQNESGVTTVVIDKGAKTDFKIFRLADPYRIDVELKDVENGFKAEYPGTKGTKVRKIVTQEFHRASGTMTRVTIYLSGEPKYEKSTQGSSLILRLP
ncbi:MAG: AMIN domain-containing protein [Pseudomonadota bacterium]